jgi:hypothetical protein
VERSGWSQSYVYDKIGNRAVTGNRSIPLANYTPQSPDGVTVPLMAQITCTERDSETGLDYFGAWYFGSALGRFTSPDPISGTMLHILHGRRCGMAGARQKSSLAESRSRGMFSMDSKRYKLCVKWVCYSSRRDGDCALSG